MASRQLTRLYGQRTAPCRTVGRPWYSVRSNAEQTWIRAFTSTSQLGSGHNKWSKIKHRKQANDAAKSSGYSSLSREIIAAVRNHPTRSTSPETNAKLGLLLRRAKSMDVSKDKVEATLNKAETMGTAAASGTHVVYEALGPVSDSGLPVALIIECQTDSPGRTRARVKEALNKNDIRLSSTAHMFQRQGLIRLAAHKDATFDRVFETAVEHGAEDVREWEIDEQTDEASSEESSSSSGVGVEIVCNPSDLVSLTSVLSSKPHSHTIFESEVKMLPNGAPMRILSLEDEESEGQEAAGWLDDHTMTKLDRLLDMLEENADCTRVWSNIDGWPSH